MHSEALAISNCDREPIHIPGIIQPFGSLIAVDRSLEIITHAAENLQSFLGVEAEVVLGQPLDQLFSATLCHDLMNVACLPAIQRQRLGKHELTGQPLDVSLHRSGDRWIIELEPLGGDPSSSISSVTRVQSILGHLQGQTESSAMLKKAVQALRWVTGFDRIIAYQLLPGGAGEVVAEACSSRNEPYLGLRYPASDIPQRVREIALRMPVRAIADITAEPVSILSCEAEAPLDLSLTYLRGISPIHVEYLINMGVKASTTLAIVVQGNLWGLFTCHHSSPKLLSPDLRSSCEIFSQLFSLKLQQALAEEQLQSRRRITSATRNLFETPTETFRFAQAAPLLNETLCPLMHADGIAVVDHGQVEISGDTPNQSTVLDLIHQCQSATGIVPIEQLQQLPLSSEAELGQSAGALVLTISSAEELYVVFFRNEISYQIRWGGNPKKEIVEDQFGPRLQPRASFEEYIESVSGHCQPWSLADMDAALELRTGLLHLAISQVGVIEQEALQQQRQQDLLIAELNHRVKNILALIRSIIRQTKESATSVEEYASMLESRIAALALAHDLVAGSGLTWPQLDELLKIEFRPYLAESEHRVQLVGPAVGLKANFVPTLVLVLHELTTNAAKYGALSVPEGQVEVRWYPEDGGLALSWRERQGPPVSVPRRRGFGRNLIERSIAYEFEGESRLRFVPAGVEADFWIPNEYILWQSDIVNSTESCPLRVEPTPQSPRGQVLIVEDNMLIAMELESTLHSLGFQPIDTAPRVSSALKLLKTETYRLGLLDINLKDEVSFAIAEVFQERQIPFLFTTGYDSKYEVPPHLATVPRLRKPIEIESLTQMIQQLLHQD
jgi:light-regulated signal transduction histidine kinase (bacteriophytochrome)/CheY-like chemotaxis protein